MVTKILAVLVLLTVTAIPALGQETTTPKLTRTVAEHFDKGWVARAFWTSAAFDYSTTGLASHICRDRYAVNSRYCVENDPIARPFIGYHDNPSWRLALGWAAESAGVSMIRNKKARRVLQVSLIAGHLICGVNNLKHWH
jgi:hypothetical protein